MKFNEYKKHVNRRQKYQRKRSGEEYEIERKKKVKRWLNGEIQSKPLPNDYLPPINIEAPENLDFINYTNDFLSYLYYGKQVLKTRKAIRFDISKIKTLGPDAIPILISHIINYEKKYHIPIFGNGPDDKKLMNLFTQSGFYTHVKSRVTFESNDESLLHKESNYKVKPDIAGKATLLALQNGKYSEEEIEPIYNIFIELMSNTHHHATLENYGQTKWWLYVFNDKDSGITSVSFLDLGVGIFRSIIVLKYIRKLTDVLKLIRNINLVDDLITGKIQSRIEADNEIRGKGIPQIMEYSKLPYFSKFYLITNDVKINLKNSEREQLETNFKGTFYYFELCSKKNSHGKSISN